MRAQLPTALRFLRKERVRFETQWQSAHANPSTHSIHALRKTTRRLRAVLWYIKQSTSHDQTFGLNGDLRQVGKALGALRELDVAVLNASSYALNASNLRKARDKNRKQIRKFLSVNRLAKLSVKIDRILLALKHDHSPNSREVLRTIQKRLLRKQAIRFCQSTDLHQLRIEIKKLRYVLEVLGRPSAPLRELQQSLGKLHDLEVLQCLTGTNASLKHDLKTASQKALRLIKPKVKQALLQLAVR